MTTSMSEVEIKLLVSQMDTADSTVEEATWEKLRPLRECVVPYLLEFFPNAKKWQGRRTIVYHALKYARTSEAAFQLGIVAIKDKATMVRYRGCCVLAYSLRKDAIPHLTELLKHEDKKSVEDARAAIDAIKNQNHHYFRDRDHTGKIVWNVNGENENSHQESWLNKILKSCHVTPNKKR